MRLCAGWCRFGRWHVACVLEGPQRRGGERVEVGAAGDGAARRWEDKRGGVELPEEVTGDRRPERRGGPGRDSGGEGDSHEDRDGNRIAAETQLWGLIYLYNILCSSVLAFRRTLDLEGNGDYN